MEQLLSYFIPENYNLRLALDKHAETLAGRVKIRGKALADVIKLHAVDLEIDEAKINGAPTKFAQEFGLLTFGLPEKLKKSEKLELDLSYHAKIQKNMEGAYLSTYRYDGKEERIITTQFESHYARNCFPCVDEPAAKATFDLRIVLPESDQDDVVLSNMPVKSHEGNETIFETTPKMSTYLLAFVVGRFRKATVKTAGGVAISTYCALNQNPSTLTYANDVAKRAIEFYDAEFGVPYPLPKLDQVAIPDFEAGAMENWGLVTYRESCLLADDASPLESKEDIAVTITHELSHQWFGDLVTMRWWDDLWLNESFATVMSYICTDALFPEYKIWEPFFTGECLSALTRDALPGVQAVKQPVKDPAEIATLFDAAIVYAKGAHLMFMLIRLMGRDKFFAGLKSYFKQHKYQNTVGDDLWAALDPFASFDVKELMDAWISQPGYPVITDGVQQRFLISGATDDSTWPLPEVSDDMSGHYLINLSGAEFAEKLENFATLSEEQRFRLLIDRLLLSETPLVSAASLLELLPEFKNETEKPLWDLLATIVNKLKLFAPYGSENYKKYQKFVKILAAPGLKRLGVKPRLAEPANETKLRPTFLAFALYADDEKNLNSLAALYNEDYEHLDPETRYAVLAAKLETAESAAEKAAGAENLDIFDKYVQKYTETADPDLKSDLLAALTDVKTEQNLKKSLKLLKNPDVVRPQDHIYLFAYLLRNPLAKEKTLNWLYENWDYVETITGDKSLDDYARVAARAVRTDDEAAAYFAFFDPLSRRPAFTRTVAVAHQEISARLRWLKLDAAAVSKKLAEIVAAEA